MKTERFFTLETESKNLFYQIPKAFMLENSKYFSMSAMAKLIYGVLKDRNSLSIKNEWVDKFNRVFFLFNQKNLCKVLGIKDTKTLRKYLNELEEYELLYRESMGDGFADRLYLLQVEVTVEQQLELLNDRLCENEKGIPKIGTGKISKGGKEKFPRGGKEKFPKGGREKFPPNNTNTNNNTKYTNNTNTTQCQSKKTCSNSDEKLLNSFNAVEVIENNTHLELSRNQISKALSWNIERLRKAIEIFKKQEGKYFALLEKIYKDNGNFAPKSNKIESNTNNNTKQSTFANFTQRKYDYDKLEAQLLGWADYDDDYEIQ